MRAVRHPACGWRFLLIDVDGTLLTDEGALTPRTQAVLKGAVSAGLTLVLASGRTHPSLLRACAEVAPPFHIIANGGAVGLSPKGESLLFTRFLERRQWRPIVQRMKSEGLSPLLFSHRHPEAPLFYVESMEGDPHFQRYLSRYHEYCRVVPDLAAAAVPNVLEVAALGKGAGFDEATGRVMGQFSGAVRSHVMVLSLMGTYGRIAEFFHLQASKWDAFAHMFPAAAAEPECVIALGDEANDMEMIQQAGLGIAMGNATPGLKAVADRVTASNNQEGLALALETLLDKLLSQDKGGID